MEFFKKHSVLVKTFITIFIPFAIFLGAYYEMMNSRPATDYIESSYYENPEALDDIVESDTIEKIETESTNKDDTSIVNLKIGQTADFDGLKFTLENAYLYDGSEATESYYKPKEGKIFLNLDIKVENTTNEQRSGGSLLITVYGDKQPTNMLALSDKIDLYSGGQLLPDTFYNETRSYEVPENATEFQVDVRDYSSDTDYVYSFTLKQ